MHAAILHLAPIMAAEKSKTPFYLAGGALVAWALLVSLGLGMRQSDFPRTAALQRLVMGVSAILVLAAVSMAVLTSGGSTGARATPAAQAASGQSARAQSPATSPATKSAAASASGQGASQRGAATGSRTGSPTKRGGTAGAQAGARSAATTLAQAADPSGQLRFASQSLSAKAGTVTVRFGNSSPLPHNFTLAKGTTIVGHTPTFQGGTRTLTVKLAAGSYKFFCTVPGHREAGMEGTLVVS